MKEKLPPGGYKIACLGFAPEIAQFNGYNTIDGYFYYYSGDYNKLMKEICEAEIKKMGDGEVKSHWVLQSNDIKNKKKIVDSLDLNYDKMKLLGTKYIFCNREIRNERLIAPQQFTKGKGKIFVYTIN